MSILKTDVALCHRNVGAKRRMISQHSAASRVISHKMTPTRQSTHEASRTFLVIFSSSWVGESTLTHGRALQHFSNPIPCTGNRATRHQFHNKHDLNPHPEHLPTTGPAPGNLHTYLGGHDVLLDGPHRHELYSETRCGRIGRAGKRVTPSSGIFQVLYIYCSRPPKMTA